MNRKILITGGREFDDWRMFIWALEGFVGPKTVLIHGNAKGADFLARVFAVAHDLEERRFDAQWQKLGKVAGIRRNAEMLALGKPDLVIAFPGGSGTADMVRRSEAAGLPVFVVGQHNYGLI